MEYDVGTTLGKRYKFYFPFISHQVGVQCIKRTLFKVVTFFLIRVLFISFGYRTVAIIVCAQNVSWLDMLELSSEKRRDLWKYLNLHYIKICYTNSTDSS